MSSPINRFYFTTNISSLTFHTETNNMKFEMTCVVSSEKLRIPVMTVADLVVVDLKHDTNRYCRHSHVMFALFRETSLSVNVWIQCSLQKFS